jgi:hypothetical protein
VLKELMSIMSYMQPMKKGRKKYTCKLSGKKFMYSVDRDLCTDLLSKELASEPRRLTKIKKQ